MPRLGRNGGCGHATDLVPACDFSAVFCWPPHQLTGSLRASRGGEGGGMHRSNRLSRFRRLVVPVALIAAAAPAGNVIRLRSLSLAPGSTATVTFQAEATCVAGSYASSIVVKQSNDFNGNPGNNFVQMPGSLDPGSVSTTVNGACQLNFLASS